MDSKPPRFEGGEVMVEEEKRVEDEEMEEEEERVEEKMEAEERQLVEDRMHKAREASEDTRRRDLENIVQDCSEIFLI